MALARAYRSRNSGLGGIIWPGFVDALSGLLLVVIFVLMVFFLIEINLAVRVANQDTSLAALRRDVAELSRLLGIEQERSEYLENQRQGLATELRATGEELSEAEAELDELEKSRAASQAEILALTQSVDALRDRLRQLQALLDEKDITIREGAEYNDELTRRLNALLASKALELERFRSEFFGRLRTILEDRDDIRIVGDRFYFRSEVLFAPGSAEINPAGQESLRALGNALNEIARDIPSNIDWVLDVSGHTDIRPINTPQYADNWQLSTERALAVVRFLIANGHDAKRIAASGFGEFKPIDDAKTDAAFARNRRIEFRLAPR